MRQYEITEGDYLIQAQAVEAPVHAPVPGFFANVHVTRVRGVAGGPRPAYSEERIGKDQVWPSPDRALRHAVRTARGIIRERPEELAC